MKFVNRYYNLRLRVLQHVVPEVVWPRTVKVDGATIEVRGAPYSFGIKKLLSYSDSYEAPERYLAGLFLTPGMNVLELGGSIGILTAVIAHKVGEEGRVVSIEADPRLTEHSQTWLKKNYGNVEVVHGFAFPVWQVPVHLNVSDFNDGNGSLGGIVCFSTNESSKENDNLWRDKIWDVKRACSDWDLEPDAVIVDIEGSELVILECDFYLPRSTKFMLIELHPGNYPKGEAQMQKIIDVILSSGFSMTHRISNTFLFTRLCD